MEEIVLIDGPDSMKRKKPEKIITEFKDLENLVNVGHLTELIFLELSSYYSEFYSFDNLFLDDIHLLNNFFTEPEYAPGDRPLKLLLEKFLGCCRSWLMKVKSHGSFKKVPTKGPMPYYMYIYIYVFYEFIVLCKLHFMLNK